jgi:hypothetical protein
MKTDYLVHFGITFKYTLNSVSIRINKHILVVNILKSYQSVSQYTDNVLCHDHNQL